MLQTRLIPPVFGRVPVEGPCFGTCGGRACGEVGCGGRGCGGRVGTIIHLLKLKSSRNNVAD
jgi:hypothetical protein